MISQQKIKELLHYDPETGVFVWKVYRGRLAKEGDVAGTITDGYNRIKVEGRLYKASRLVWMYMYGKWPSDFIDHINGDRADDRLVNLREATSFQNAVNKKGRSSSGFKGVYRHQDRWRADIRYEGKRYFLGVFDTPELASNAYNSAATKIHGVFANTSHALM